ncbi:MAG: hypothetical protein LQ352_001620 [Teloschistes flavicans]|nr:MAG: hypothetical protein LQ352_001620 [Teloschistes flavicans]
MEVRGLTTLCHRALNRNTLLPFLYQTTTIQPPVPLAPPTVRQRSFHTTRPRQGVYIKNHNTIPFENEDGTQEQDLTKLNPNEGRSERKFTITAPEKAVFDRISKAITDHQILKASKEKDPLGDDDDEVGPELLGGDDNVFSDLDAIFDEGLTKAKSLDEAKTHKATGERPLKRPYLALRPIVDTKARTLERSMFIGDGYRKDIAVAVADHHRKVLAIFDAAKSDREIWNTLETEVFTLIKKYDSLEKKATGQQEQAEKPTRKAGRPKVNKPATTDARKTKSLHAAAAESDDEETLYAILSSNFGGYCLTAQRHLRRSYPTSPYCMSLLPAIKRLGPMSHALAASVDLYNEILFLQWKEYSDLHGMADTIIEMGNLAIETNQTTLLILQLIRKDRNHNRRLTEDTPMRLWWTMAPVKEGWQKLKNLSRMMVEEREQARMRRAMVEAQRRRTEEEGVFAVEHPYQRSKDAVTPST